MVVALSKLVWTFPGGQKVKAITSLTLVNNTAKNLDLLCGTGKIIIILHVRAINADNVNRGVLIRHYNEAAATNLISMVCSATIVTLEVLQWPNTDMDELQSTTLFYPLILVAGNILRISWAAGGASAGATDADGLVIEYLEIDE